MCEAKYGIALAAPTGLYAPLYLAKLRSTQKSNSLFKLVRFEYLPEQKRPEQQSRSGQNGQCRDLLMDYILCGTPIARTHGKSGAMRPECIFGVCDPVRAFLRPEARHSEPLILGTLVQHMFFWLVDHDTAVPAGEHRRVPELFQSIITAPRHMTSYTIASYFLKNECVVPEDAIPNHLFPIPVPGLEAEAYRYFQKHKHTKDYSYLTLDTEDVFNPKPGERVKLDFDDNPKFRDCVMTAIVVNKKRYADGNGGIIDGLIEEINDAVRSIRTDADAVATELGAWSDGWMDFSNRDQTLRLLHYLNDREAFPSAPGINIQQINRNLRIRREMLRLHPFAEDFCLPASDLADRDWERYFGKRDGSEAILSEAGMCEADRERVSAWMGRLRDEHAQVKAKCAKAEKTRALAEHEQRHLSAAIAQLGRSDHRRTGITVSMAVALVVMSVLDVVFTTEGIDFVPRPESELLRNLPNRFVLFAAPLMVLGVDAGRYLFGPPSRDVYNHFMLAALLVFSLATPVNFFLRGEINVAYALIAVFLGSGAFGAWLKNQPSIAREILQARKDRKDQEKIRWKELRKNIYTLRPPHLPDKRAYLEYVRNWYWRVAW